MNIPILLEGIKESVLEIEVSNESGETHLKAENAINIRKRGIGIHWFILPGIQYRTRRSTPHMRGGVIWACTVPKVSAVSVPTPSIYCSSKTLLT